MCAHWATERARWGALYSTMRGPSSSRLCYWFIRTSREDPETNLCTVYADPPWSPGSHGAPLYCRSSRLLHRRTALLAMVPVATNRRLGLAGRAGFARRRQGRFPCCWLCVWDLGFAAWFGFPNFVITSSPRRRNAQSERWRNLVFPPYSLARSLCVSLLTLPVQQAKKSNQLSCPCDYVTSVCAVYFSHNSSLNTLLLYILLKQCDVEDDKKTQTFLIMF